MLRPSEFVKGGKRKNILRLACKEYLPFEILDRRDKVGFYTPLQNILGSWAINNNLLEFDNDFKEYITKPTLNKAMEVFRLITLKNWMLKFILKSE